MDVLDAFILAPYRGGSAGLYCRNLPELVCLYGLNLEEPFQLVKQLLQGIVMGTFVSLGRFLLKLYRGPYWVSWIVASKICLAPEEEEFGEVIEDSWG